MKNREPLVTVFVPVYNAEKYLKETIDSVIHQTYENWELLLINDGSSDCSVEIIGTFSDPRIHLYHNDGNKGIPYTRNRGLELARGEYIAFLDADDIALPDRLERQVSFLQQHPQYHVVGSWFHVLTEKGIKKQRFHFGEYQVRNTGMIFMPVLGTSTMMLRRSFIQENKLRYRSECFVAQDYAFLVDCAKYTDMVCLSKPVSIYRTGHENITKRSSEEKTKARRNLIAEIQKRSIDNLGIDLSEDQKIIFNEVFSDPPLMITPKTMKQGLNVLQSIEKQFCERGEKTFATETYRILLPIVCRMKASIKEKVTCLNIHFINESFTAKIIMYLLFVKSLL